jgi:hypothetical protein
MWPIAVPLPAIDAAIVAQAFVEKVILEHGGVTFIQTDRGACFNSRLFTEICMILGIRHNMSSAFTPRSQGVLERYHSTLKGALRSYIYESTTQIDWCHFVPYAVFAFRTTFKRSIGMTPFECLRGYQAPPVPRTGILYDNRTPYNTQLGDFASVLKRSLSEAWSAARNCWLSQQQLREAKANLTAKANPVMEGDVVYKPRHTKLPGLSGSLCAKYDGPYTVRKVYHSTAVLAPRGKRTPLTTVNVSTLKVARNWEEPLLSDNLHSYNLDVDHRKRHPTE